MIRNIFVTTVLMMLLCSNALASEESGVRDEWGIPSTHKELDWSWQYGQIHFQRRDFEQFIMRKLKKSLLILEKLELNSDWKEARVHFNEDFEPLFAYYIGNTATAFPQKKEAMDKIAFTLKMLKEKYRAEGDKSKLDDPSIFDNYSAKDIRFYCSSCHQQYLKE